MSMRKWEGNKCASLSIWHWLLSLLSDLLVVGPLPIIQVLVVVIRWGVLTAVTTWITVVLRIAASPMSISLVTFGLMELQLPFRIRSSMVMARLTLLLKLSTAALLAFSTLSLVITLRLVFMS